MSFRYRSLVITVCLSAAACGDDTSSGGAGPSGGADVGGSGGTGELGGSPAGGGQVGGAEAGGAEAGGAAPQSNPYTDCEMDTVDCPVPGSLCPFDSTGSVCAPPCDTVADCPALAGAANEPECFEINTGDKYCVVPCGSTAECPAGMECLFVGLTPECGWE